MERGLNVYLFSKTENTIIKTCYNCHISITMVKVALTPTVEILTLTVVMGVRQYGAEAPDTENLF